MHFIIGRVMPVTFDTCNWLANIQKNDYANGEINQTDGFLSLSGLKRKPPSCLPSFSLLFFHFLFAVFPSIASLPSFFLLLPLFRLSCCKTLINSSMSLALVSTRAEGKWPIAYFLPLSLFLSASFSFFFTFLLVCLRFSQFQTWSRRLLGFLSFERRRFKQQQ